MRRFVIIGLWVAIGIALAVGIDARHPVTPACACGLWSLVPTSILMLITVTKWGALLHLGFSGELD